MSKPYKIQVTLRAPAGNVITRNIWSDELVEWLEVWAERLWQFVAVKRFDWDAADPRMTRD